MGLKQNGAAMAQPKILLTRIDDRFIYGQDVELWNESVGSNLVLIVNDEIAADSRQWAPMRVTAPEGVWTRFFSVQRTIDIIHTATPRQWILIMVASPADALALVKGGVPITKISVGHMQAGEGKRPATPAVSIDDAGVTALRELQKLGVELEIRYLPSSAPDPIGNLFNRSLGDGGKRIILVPRGWQRHSYRAARTKLCRITGLSHESPTIPKSVKIKPQVDEPSFCGKHGYGWGS